MRMTAEEYDHTFESVDVKSWDRKVLDYLDYINDDASRRIAYHLLTDVDGSLMTKYKHIIESHSEVNR